MITSETVEADIAVGSLSVADVNRTVNGNVSDVTLSTDLAYEHDVPDADRRVLKLKVGPSADNLETVAFRNDRDVAGTDSGTVILSGSVLDHTEWTAGDMDPALAATKTTELTVQAEIEITRANGQTVTDTVTDTVTVTLHDGSELTAAIGGDGTLTVETDA